MENDEGVKEPLLEEAQAPSIIIRFKPKTNLNIFIFNTILFLPNLVFYKFDCLRQDLSKLDKS